MRDLSKAISDEEIEDVAKRINAFLQGEGVYPGVGAMACARVAGAVAGRNCVNEAELVRDSKDLADYLRHCASLYYEAFKNGLEKKPN